MCVRDEFTNVQPADEKLTLRQAAMSRTVRCQVATSEPTDFSPVNRLPASRGKCQLFNLKFRHFSLNTTTGDRRFASGSKNKVFA